MKQFNNGKIALINKGIAEFEGRVNTNWNTISSHPIDDLQYHSSWDWLMPVINKIATDVRFRTRFHMSGFPINVSISGHGGVYIAINEGNCAGEEYKELIKEKEEEISEEIILRLINQQGCHRSNLKVDTTILLRKAIVRITNWNYSVEYRDNDLLISEREDILDRIELSEMNEVFDIIKEVITKEGLQ